MMKIQNTLAFALATIDHGLARGWMSGYILNIASRTQVLFVGSADKRCYGKQPGFTRGNLFSIVLISFLLASCATPLKESQLKSISTVGVLNQFDENPRYMIIGSTIFTNEISEINNSEFKTYLSNNVKNYLEKAGYSVVMVNEQDSPAVDLVLKLRPTSIYQAEFMQGYGVVERFLFGKSHGAGAYISIAVDPIIAGKPYGTLTMYTTDKVTHVEGLEHLAQTWEQLTSDQQNSVKAALNQSIEQAVNEVLPQSGL